MLCKCGGSVSMYAEVNAYETVELLQPPWYWKT